MELELHNGTFPMLIIIRPGSNAADKSSKMKTQKWPLDLAMEVIGNLGKSNLGRVEGMKAGRGWTKEKKSCR